MYPYPLPINNSMMTTSNNPLPGSLPGVFSKTYPYSGLSPPNSSSLFSTVPNKSDQYLKKVFDFGTLKITLNITGDYKNTESFTSKMILPNEPATRDGDIVYFSPIIKYTDELFTGSKVPKLPSTFLEQNTFRKLIEYGIKTQDVPNYQTNRSVEITNFNIRTMVNLLFKEGGDLYIPYTVNDQYRRYQIRKFSLRTVFTNDERNKIKKDERIPIIVDIEVLDSKKLTELKKGDYKRMDCKDKKDDIMKHLYGMLGRIYKPAKQEDTKPVPHVLLAPPTHSSRYTHIENRDVVMPRYTPTPSSYYFPKTSSRGESTTLGKSGLSNKELLMLGKQQQYAMNKPTNPMVPTINKKPILSDQEEKAGKIVMDALKKNQLKQKIIQNEAAKDLVKARQQGKLKFGGQNKKYTRRKGRTLRTCKHKCRCTKCKCAKCKCKKTRISSSRKYISSLTRKRNNKKKGKRTRRRRIYFTA